MRLMPRSARHFAATAAVASAALIAPAVALAAPASPAAHAGKAAPAVLACETPGLVEWVVPNGAAAGHFIYTLNFTNLSGHACTLNGYPFLFAVGLRGHQIGRRAGVTLPKPHQVTIPNHGTATASLDIVDVLNFPKSTCHPVWAAGLKVFPPNQQRAKIIPLPFQACSAAAVKFITVGAVK